MPGPTAKEIDAEAADWAARIDRAPLSPDEDARFQAWLDSDVRRPGAYARMRALALSTERARALGADFDPAVFVSHRPARRTVLRAGGAIAAALLLGVTATWQILRQQGRFTTAKGESRSIALKDGSVVTLNTASEIRIDFTDRLRGVDLVHGEALFDVAKDKARPFMVTAGDTRVQAVGTSFTVRRLDSLPVQVLVREGIVEVSRAADGAAPVRLSANAMAEAAPDAVAIAIHAVPAAQVHRLMAWQSGQIAFEGETLAQAATEFSRYSDTRIVIDDPALAREEIAGLFKATDPVGFARTVAISLNARANVGEGEVRLTR